MDTFKGIYMAERQDQEMLQIVCDIACGKVIGTGESFYGLSQLAHTMFRSLAILSFFHPGNLLNSASSCKKLGIVLVKR